MKRSVMFFDIDGTLLSEITRKIPRSAIDALKEAKKRGHLLFINTGRTRCSIPEEIKRFPFDGYLCGCGTCLIYRDEVLFARSLPEARGKEILEKIPEYGLGGIAEGPEDVYFPKRMSRFDGLESSRRYFQEKGLGSERYIEDQGFVYDKLLVYADEKSDLDGFLKFIEEDLTAIDRGRNTYEIIQKGYSKATACGFILDKLSFSKEQAYVFGDSSNDLEMFRFADHTVAMGRHDDVLEPYTEYVTKSVEDDGIAFAMKYYGLI